MDVRILIVDDHPTVRESLRFVLSAVNIAQMMEATTRVEALDALRSRCVDVVLLDVVLCGEIRLDVLRDVKAIAPAVPVLVHSYRDNCSLLSQCFHAGAAGYIVKGQDKNLLLDAIRHAASGDNVWTHDQMDRIHNGDMKSNH